MSCYEIVAIVIAGLALIQPWIILLYNTKNYKIKIIPYKEITLNFWRRGLSIISFVSLLSKNKDCVLSNLKVEISNDLNIIYQLDWDIFMNPYERTYYNKKQTVDENIATYANPLFLEKNKPSLNKVQFVDYKIEKEVTELINIENLKNDLLLKFKFEKGLYEIVFTACDINGKTFSEKYCFTLKENDIFHLRNNADSIIQKKFAEGIKVILHKEK